MKSENLEGDSTVRAACLARNVSTKNINMKMTSEDVVYEQSTPILTSDALYNSIKVVGVTKGTEVNCSATVNDNTYESKEEVEEPVTVKVCNTTDTSTQDTEVEKTNMLSMTVLGLRVLLAKSIAFNTLMSIKLFLF
ncbi:TRDC protein, partial [Atlantisia rogersi]|nr:TRDC protein [Atlantisia rogersi]